ncbi:HMG-Y-related protein A-like [Macadamia integrifolia]|uniref:HMG-Y-related protein A-like n=1 Tax=Macadamia integrifolia TaxID=60698 RepID=UPI001C50131B|nr:HMG-Y-related protein A-like [Macadamia integrifolia]
MATEEVNKPSSHPQYSEMIFAAIAALNDKYGSNKSAISKYIESQYVDLPAAHSDLLPIHLNRLKESGELVLVKNNYMRPSPNAPPKRGRGRPPKPKVPLPPGHVSSPPKVSRPRGRPPKPRDPNSVPTPKISSGRPRGRPPKKAKPAGAAATAKTGPPRPRGRPPKVRAPFASAGFD